MVGQKRARNGKTVGVMNGMMSPISSLLTFFALLSASPAAAFRSGFSPIRSPGVVLMSTRSSSNDAAVSRTFYQPASSLPNTTTPPKKQRSRLKTKPMPVTGYDSKAIEEYYDRRPLEVGWRLNSLSFPMLGTCATKSQVHFAYDLVSDHIPIL
jgi:hypothetical protein